MALHTLEEGKQQYTLKVRDLETKQETLAQYNGSAILTTDHDELIQYAARMTVHFGTNKIYTVSFVTPITMCCGVLAGELVNTQLTAIHQEPTVLKLGTAVKEIPIERKFDFSDED